MGSRFKIVFACASIAALVVGLALTGCSSGGSSSSAASSGSASGSGASSASSSSSEVVLDNEDVISIGLDYNAGTGYEWQYTMDPEGVIAVTGQSTEDLSGDKSIAGGGLREVFDLRANKPGEVTITFKLVRPWEENAEPAEEQVYAFTVNDDLKIILNPYKSNFSNEPVWGSNA